MLYIDHENTNIPYVKKFISEKLQDGMMQGWYIKLIRTVKKQWQDNQSF